MIITKRALYLKRRQCALDYFIQFPENRVKLEWVVDGPDTLRWRESYGLDCLKCDAVACVQGCLYTMPEFRDSPEFNFWNLHQSIHEFLGLDPNNDQPIFSARCEEVDGPDVNNPNISDKELGIRRLQRLVHALE